MKFPNNCVKGIPTLDCLYEDDNVASPQLFKFNGDPREQDGWVEESINWMDDEGAVALTLNQKRVTGELQFSIGVAILGREHLDKVKKQHRHFFKYERAPIVDTNLYHGNLLLKGGIKKERKRLISGILAHYSQIRRRQD